MGSNRYEINDEIYITDLLTEEDIPSFIKYLNNQKIHANTLVIPYPYTTKDGEDFVKMKATSPPNSTKYFGIRLNTNNELIGACGLYRSLENERRAEIGYWLGEPYWNRGLMPQVIKKIVEIGKNEWKNLVRIEATIFWWNKASMRAAEKGGFEFEGILRRYLHKNGQDIDIHLYALILE